MSNQPNSDPPPTGESPVEMRRDDEPSQTWWDARVAIPVFGADIFQVYDAFTAPRQTLSIPSDVHDSINSIAPFLLKSINRQIWMVPSMDYFPTSVSHLDIDNDATKPDCVVLFGNWRGDGLIIPFYRFILTVNCGSIPVSRGPSPPGELPVIVIHVDLDMISLLNVIATMTYFYNHDMSQLFYAVLDHLLPGLDPVLPFPGGQRKTSASPIIIDDGTLDIIARILSEHLDMQEQLELLKIYIEGFYYIQISLDITDLGFLEVVSTALAIVNRALDLNEVDSAELDDTFGVDDEYPVELDDEAELTDTVA
ncbi:uncharacterized protein BT62DRAFT_1036131 [Guyanagaster necrorhizus]|uniref:Uncharacterized protein n=1 Tax=Guyanagaster necrorhizus TaxID=856835 RepID=A0A9P7VM20_9AGAR|nr:uncharacterized protein BT62DRAFT_1036131 [Guyanagaster necrorhizus MCA 3950]KAG7442947.1 hypothetical protein BT62DRAFT_1036131 [Guyanagaster necrorhizus MCA 3950]